LIPFGYVGNLVFFTKYSRICKKKKKCINLLYIYIYIYTKKRGRENGTFINKKMNIITS
jgi:hypothetical protein